MESKGGKKVVTPSSKHRIGDHPRGGSPRTPAAGGHSSPIGLGHGRVSLVSPEARTSYPGLFTLQGRRKNGGAYIRPPTTSISLRERLQRTLCSSSSCNSCTGHPATCLKAQIADIWQPARTEMSCNVKTGRMCRQGSLLTCSIARTRIHKLPSEL